MMRSILLASLVAAFTGCAASATSDQLSTALTQTATLVANACKVVQPTVSGVATVTGDSALTTGATINGVFCAANTAAVAGAASTAAVAGAASAPAASK
ncbi:MAG: hypothetical protein P4L92_18720 [Rudaea sp.]|nr:hypothetical protein [Rudaea sp.]